MPYYSIKFDGIIGLCGLKNYMFEVGSDRLKNHILLSIDLCVCLFVCLFVCVK